MESTNLEKLHTLATQAAINGVNTYIAKAVHGSPVNPEQVAARVLQSARLSKIHDGIQSLTTKTLYSESRAKGPTQPGSVLPYQDTLTPDERARFGDPTGAHSLIAIASTLDSGIRINNGERKQILESAGYVRAACLAPLSLKRLYGRIHGKNTYDATGDGTAAMEPDQIFDALCPKNMSLATAVLTARSAATKTTGGLDTFAYYECPENNFGAHPGENWQRSGPMFGITKAIAEVWNAAVQAHMHHPKPRTAEFTEMQRMLFTTKDAMRVCAAISLAASANPVQAERELQAFHVHLATEEARVSTQKLLRFSPEHIQFQTRESMENHVEECVQAKNDDAVETERYKHTIAAMTPEELRQLQERGELVVTDGAQFRWLAPACRPAKQATCTWTRPTPVANGNSKASRTAARNPDRDSRRQPRSR
jgi:hypothetical protein